MSEIPEIGVANINVRGVYIPQNRVNVNDIPNIHPPVTLDLGFPIVEMPGCVEAHPENRRKSKLLPNLSEDDSKSVMTFCPHGQYPSYDAMNFEPENLPPTIVAKPGTPPPPPPGAASPDTSKVAEKKEVECPGPNAPRIGDVAQNKTERVSGFELSKDGKICITLYEDIPFTAQYLPAPQVVASTGGIAVVATTSALLAKPLADLLLKVVKPVVKKVIAKVNAILGKTPYRPTSSEIQTNHYREKKGMLPINFAKKKKPKKKVEEKKP